MCGPSKAMKNLNKTVQNFTSQVTSEAGTIFGAANSVFNNIVNATQSIINGGPSQAGFSQNELDAMNAANVEAGGTMARNLKAVAAGAAGAIGGGNAVTPSGSTQAAVMNAETQAAAEEAAGENAITQADYATGRNNFFKSLGIEEQAPDVFNPATAANKEAGAELQNAETSQQNIDTASNWWKADLNKIGTTAIGAGVGAFTGGLGTSLAGKVMGSTMAMASPVPSASSTSTDTQVAPS